MRGSGCHENAGEIVETVHENDADCMIPKVVGGPVVLLTIAWTNIIVSALSVLQCRKIMLLALASMVKEMKIINILGFVFSDPKLCSELSKLS